MADNFSTGHDSSSAHHPTSTHHDTGSAHIPSTTTHHDTHTGYQAVPTTTETTAVRVHESDGTHHGIHHDDKHHHETNVTEVTKYHDDKHHHGTNVTEVTKHHHDTHTGYQAVPTTETTTAVKVVEHEDTHHGIQHDDKHHHGTKHHDDKHHHGIKDDRHHDATVVQLDNTDKDTHLKAEKTEKKRKSKKNRLSGKKEKKVKKDKHHGTEETKVKVSDHHGTEETKVKVSDHHGTRVQDTHRTEGTGLVQQLRTTLAESDTPNMDVLSELLLRAETLLAKSTNQHNIDPEARKTLEDISTLLLTAKQMEKHKAISERLQRISDECQKSLSSMNTTDAPEAVKHASKEAVDLVNVWRPVFQLLIRSRDFRQLFVDSLRIAKRVLSRNEGIMDDLTQQFIEGENAQSLKERAKEHRDTNVDLKMTDEEWDYLQDEILSVLAILARNPTYHDAINRLFSLLDVFSTNMKGKVPSSGELEPHARKAKLETEELVATFTGRDTLNDFKFSLRRLIHVLNNDAQLQQYFSDLKVFILSSKSEEEVRSEAFKLRSRELINRGRFLVHKSKDRQEIDQFLEISSRLLDNIKNDEYVKELRARAGIVRSDLTYVDTEGRTKVDVDMLVKLQSVLMPVLAGTFTKIQIPRIESSDKRLDFSVDNIVLCGYDIFPDNIKFHVERDSEVSIREVESKGSHTRLVIHLDKIRTEIKNIEFYFKRKTFPSLSDSGLVTFRIPANGAHLSIYFTIEDRHGDSKPHLTEGYADFDIHKMDIEFDKSTLKHDVLLPMATTIMKPIIQSKIEKAVETNLTSALKQVGERLTQVLGELNRPVFGSVKDAIKSSEPAQVAEQRREKLE